MVLSEAPVSNSISHAFLSISTGNINSLQGPREWATLYTVETILSLKFSVRTFSASSSSKLWIPSYIFFFFHLPLPFTAGLQVHCKPLFLLRIIMRFPMKASLRGVTGFPTTKTFRITSTHFVYSRVTMYHRGSLFRLFSGRNFSIETCKVNVAPDSNLHQWIQRTFKPQSADYE